METGKWLKVECWCRWPTQWNMDWRKCEWVISQPIYLRVFLPHCPWIPGLVWLGIEFRLEIHFPQNVWDIFSSLPDSSVAFEIFSPLPNRHLPLIFLYYILSLSSFWGFCSFWGYFFSVDFQDFHGDFNFCFPDFNFKNLFFSRMFFVKVSCNWFIGIIYSPVSEGINYRLGEVSSVASFPAWLTCFCSRAWSHVLIPNCCSYWACGQVLCHVGSPEFKWLAYQVGSPRWDLLGTWRL